MADSFIHLSASARQVAGALAEVHQATVVELAASAGVSKSTVAKTLTALERAGAAQRMVRETEDGIREADLWSPGPGLSALLFSTAAAEDGCNDADVPVNADETDWFGTAITDRGDVPEPVTRPRGESIDTADGAAPGSDPSSAHTSTEAAACPENSAVVGAAKPCTDAAQLGVAATFPDTAVTTPPTERLAPGGLAQLVAAALARHPDIDYTPTQLSHLLGGRSSGAITNALEKMIKDGVAVRTCDKPKRYRHGAA